MNRSALLIASRICELVGRLLGSEIPDRLRVVEETKVVFHVADGRVHHDGFAMMLPHREASIDLRTTGSVGLDSSLDVQVEIDLPSGLLGQSKLAKQMCEQPIAMHVGGTLDEPVVELDANGLWLDRVEALLASDTIGDTADDLVERTANVLRELSANRQPREERLLPKLRDRWRDRRERRQKNKDEQSPIDRP